MYLMVLAFKNTGFQFPFVPRDTCKTTKFVEVKFSLCLFTIKAGYMIILTCCNRCFKNLLRNLQIEILLFNKIKSILNLVS